MSERITAWVIDQKEHTISQGIFDERGNKITGSGNKRSIYIDPDLDPLAVFQLGRGTSVLKMDQEEIDRNVTITGQGDEFYLETDTGDILTQPYDINVPLPWPIPARIESCQGTKVIDTGEKVHF